MVWDENEFSITELKVLISNAPHIYFYKKQDQDTSMAL